MKTETRNVAIIEGLLNIRRYSSRVIGAVRTAINRSGKHATSKGTTAVQQACTARERCLAESAAMLQPARYNR